MTPNKNWRISTTEGAKELVPRGAKELVPRRHTLGILVSEKTSYAGNSADICSTVGSELIRRRYPIKECAHPSLVNPEH